MTDNVIVVIHHNIAKRIYWQDKDLPTNTEVVLSWSDYVKLSRLFLVDIKNPTRDSYNPQLWKNKIYGFIGDADASSGFGNCSVNLLRQSVLNGYDVKWIGRGYEVPELAAVAQQKIPPDMGVVWHEQPGHKWRQSPFERNIGIVPFETTRIPPSWVDIINQFSALFVPSKQNVQMMLDSGIKIPIELIHWGVNEKQFKKVSRISDDFFTFGTMGSLSTRKGTDLLVKAFSLAFPMRDFKDVRLICKTSSNRYDFSSRDPRIFVQMGATDFQDLMNTFIKKIDCFVFPTRGEGFGLPPLEMAACGIPSIVTGWSGPLEYFKPEMGWLLNYKMVEATSFREKIYHEPCGEWAEPDFVQLIDTMRYAYHHKDEIKQKGEFAAQYVADNWTWDKQIHLYFEALSKHL